MLSFNSKRKCEKLAVVAHRSPKYVQLVHFTLLCSGRLGNVKRFITRVQNQCCTQDTFCLVTICLAATVVVGLLKVLITGGRGGGD